MNADVQHMGGKSEIKTLLNTIKKKNKTLQQICIDAGVINRIAFSEFTTILFANPRNSSVFHDFDWHYSEYHIEVWSFVA